VRRAASHPHRRPQYASLPLEGRARVGVLRLHHPRYSSFNQSTPPTSVIPAKAGIQFLPRPKTGPGFCRGDATSVASLSPNPNAVSSVVVPSPLRGGLGWGCCGSITPDTRLSTNPPHPPASSRRKPGSSFLSQFPGLKREWGKSDADANQTPPPQSSSPPP